MATSADSDAARFDSAFRGACDAVFGAVPPEIARDALTLDWTASPVGPLLIGATAEAVGLLEFCDLKSLGQRLISLRARSARRVATGTNPLLATLRAQLEEYFAARRREFTLPLAYGGSDFQNRVWSLLREIPYGATWSYRELAERAGDLSATRAVGAANGQNPIAIVIPCHRVIYANGDLGGFGGGLWRKEILLDLEKGQARLF